MSLILEALRKSEAERRRGQTPDPFAQITVSPRVHRAATPTWVWVGLTALVLVVLAWLARDWWLSGNASATDVARIAQSKQDDISATQPSPGTPRRSDAPTSRTTPTTSAQPSAALPSVPATSTMHPEPTAPVASPPVAPPSDASLQLDPASTASATPTAPSAIPTAPPATPTTSEEETISLSALPAAERKQLPALKVSMHIYAAASSARFVIIDGNRLAEGDSIGDAMIEQITADGVVLSWNGRRVRLPLR